MKKVIFILLLLLSTQVNAQWIGTRSSCNVSCMSEGDNPASGHMIWGDRGTIGAGVTFALQGELIIGIQASTFNGPVPKPIKRNVEILSPTYSICGILGAQLNPLCLSMRVGLGQYSRISQLTTDKGPKQLLIGGYVTAMITDRVGLELGGDSFNGSTIGISYQF
jgi:hypothetical protein